MRLSGPALVVEGAKSQKLAIGYFSKNSRMNITVE